MKRMESVEVSASTRDLGVQLVKFIADLKKALDDGWQPGQDIPAVLSATMVDLVPAVKAMPQLAPEFNEDIFAFADAWYLTGRDAMKVFVVKK